MSPTMNNPSDQENPKRTRKRGPRRATVAGTGPAAADGPEPKLDELNPKTKKSSQPNLSERDRWMLEQKPPHY